MLEGMQRLVDYAGGRQIAVPLSGGYDSRLIAMLLKELKYDNVVSFTYGTPNNREATVSRAVAEALGFRWEFVPYDKVLWRELNSVPERDEYNRIASGWVSLPHIQDWPAVWQLRRLKKIASDAIFVPGHTGDFICGGHIPQSFRQSECARDEDLIREIFDRHYALVLPARKRREKWRQTFAARIFNGQAESLMMP